DSPARGCPNIRSRDSAAPAAATAAKRTRDPAASRCPPTPGCCRRDASKCAFVHFHRIRVMKWPKFAVLLLLTTGSSLAQDAPATARALERQSTLIRRSFEDVDRETDDALWYFKLG